MSREGHIKPLRCMPSAWHTGGAGNTRVDEKVLFSYLIIQLYIGWNPEPHCGTQSSCEQFSSNLHLDAHKSQPCGSALSSLDPCALHSALFCVFRALSGCRPPNIRKSVAISQAQFHRLQLVTLSLSSSGILLTLINCNNRHFILSILCDPYEDLNSSKNYVVSVMFTVWQTKCKSLP